jgi:hypothetical protein
MLFLAGAPAAVADDPPRYLAGKGLGAVLVASRNVGLVLGIGMGLIFGLAFGFVIGFVQGPAGGFALGPAVAVMGGLVFALVGGLNSETYYHWLRYRLAREGYLPRRLQPFLEWCAAPGRGWLRLSDACEFRHRELLDYLASEQGKPAVVPEVHNRS